MLRSCGINVCCTHILDIKTVFLSLLCCGKFDTITPKLMTKLEMSCQTLFNIPHHFNVGQ